MEISIGEKIRNLREDSNLNQTEFGRALNMTQRKLSYIECNKCEPSIGDIKAVCNYFKISADYLLGIKKRALPPGLIGYFITAYSFFLCPIWSNFLYNKKGI